MIGAGAAGLLAARELRRSGHRVAVVEARERVGGPIHTHADARVPPPIELGAEFIHGAAPETRRLLREASLLAWDVDGETWRVRGRPQGRAESWQEVDAVLRRPSRPTPLRSRVRSRVGAAPPARSIGRSGAAEGRTRASSAERRAAREPDAPPKRAPRLRPSARVVLGCRGHCERAATILRAGPVEPGSADGGRREWQLSPPAPATGRFPMHRERASDEASDGRIDGGPCYLPIRFTRSTS